MPEEFDGLIRFGMDFSNVVTGTRTMESVVESSTARMNAKLASLGGGSSLGAGLATNFEQIGTHMEGLERRSQTLLTHLDRMSNVFTGGMGIGVAVGGFALLERAFDRAIEKARTFQTAAISIAASLSSAGYRTDIGGSRLNSQAAFDANLKYAQQLQVQLLAASAKNHLTFQEQLGAFQSSIATGLGKGMNIEQVFKISDLGAMAAKSLGLRGEQIANATRLLMGGGVNVSRSTIGRALGISNTDIAARSGDTLTKFLEIKLKGFQAAQSEFGSSIEGVVSTLQSKLDTMLAKVGMNFFNRIKPSLMKIIDATESPIFRGDKERAQETAGEYKKRYDTFLQGQVTQNKLIESLSSGFEGLYGALQKLVTSGAFDAFVKFLSFLANNSQTILLGAVFLKIADAIGTAQSAAMRFATTLKGLVAVEELAGISHRTGGGAASPTIAMRGARGTGGAATTMAMVEGELIPILTQQPRTSFLEAESKRSLSEFIPAYPGAPGGRPMHERFGEDVLRRAQAREDAEMEFQSWGVGSMVPYKTLSKEGLLEERLAGITGMQRPKLGSSLIENLKARGRLGLAGGAEYVSGAAGRLPGAAIAAMGGSAVSDMLGSNTFGGRFASGAGMGGGAGLLVGGLPGAIAGAIGGGAAATALGALTDAADDAAKALVALRDTSTRTPQGTAISNANELYRIRRQAEVGMPDINRRRAFEHFIENERDVTLKSGVQGSTYKGYFNEAKNEAEILKARVKEEQEYSGSIIDQHKVAIDNLRIKAENAKAEFWEFKERGQMTGEAEQGSNALVKSSAAYKAAQAQGNTARMQALLNAGQGSYERNLLNKRLGVVNQGISGENAELPYQQASARAVGINNEKIKAFNDTIASVIADVTKNIKGGVEGTEGAAIIKAAKQKAFHDLALEIESLSIKGSELSLDRRKLSFEESKFGRERPLERQEAVLGIRKAGFAQTQFGLKQQGLLLEQKGFGLESEDLDLADKAAEIQKEERAIAKDELQDRAAGVNRAKTRRINRYNEAKEKRPLEMAEAQLGVSEAQGAEALFYGGMGPVSKIAAAIRFKVEAEFAGQFNPSEYEAAYRQKIQNEIASVRLAKRQAEFKPHLLEEEFQDRDEEESEARIQDKLNLRKINDDLKKANLAELQAKNEQAKRGLARQQHGLRGQEIELEQRMAPTEQSELAIASLKSANSLQDFDEETGLLTDGFKNQEAQLKLSVQEWTDQVDKVNKLNATLDLTEKAMLAAAEKMAGIAGISVGSLGNRTELALIGSAHSAIIANSSAASATIHRDQAGNPYHVSGDWQPGGMKSQGGNNYHIPVSIDGKVTDNEHTHGLKRVVKEAIEAYCETERRKPK